jgi:TolB-like protein
MRGFIEELRHRNVFRVGVAYIIAGWLIAQAADLATDAFNAPEWFMQMLIILLLVGLPIALFLAWAYELTPEGMKKAREIPADAPKDPRSGRVLNRIIIATLILAIAGLIWERTTLDVLSEAGDANDKSIAVLPFSDFSPDGDHVWFADGLTEEILNALARTPDLEIASRTSSFAFRDATDDIPAIAAQLGVAHILEGSVRRAGDRLRVTAQLIRAADDKHLWSENFDGSSEDSIEIQERIAFAIASALKTAMDPEELAKMVSAGTRSVEAWETYLMGLALYQQDVGSGMPENISRAIELLDRAAEIDSGFAEAYLLLAEVWQTQLDVTSTVYSSDGIPLADRASQFRRAIDAGAKNARTEMMRLEAELLEAGFDNRLLDTIRIGEAIVELAPESIENWGNLAYAYIEAGNLAKARDAALRGLALKKPSSAINMSYLIEILQRASPADVRPYVETFLQRENPTPNDLYQSHRALLAAGLNEHAAEVADRYVHSSDDVRGRVMVEVRQACAEGRDNDAELLFAAIDQSDLTLRWLFLKTLGRDDEALNELLSFDRPETFSVLSGYLGYLVFDVSDFPEFASMLALKGVNRPPQQRPVYYCEPDDA